MHQQTWAQAGLSHCSKYLALCLPLKEVIHASIHPHQNPLQSAKPSVHTWIALWASAVGKEAYLFRQS